MSKKTLTDEEIKKIIEQSKPIHIPESDKVKALQSAVHYLGVEQQFLGALLQQLVMRYSYVVPTAGIHFDKEREYFIVEINPGFFCPLPTEQRVAILHHEILHFVHQHLTRMPMTKGKNDDNKLRNIAADMAINQYIRNLPEGCVDVNDWKQEVPGPTKVDPKVEQPFPLRQNMETYYDLIKKNKKANKDKLQKYKEFDSHDWEELDEATKQKLMEEAKKVIKRTMEKSSFSHSNVPDSIKDLLTELEVETAALDYKRILQQVIKRTVSATNRDSTWKRPNKRYGMAAPGTRIALLPKCHMFLDTSGSISHTELNLFLDVMSGFLKVGSRDCQLILWHTKIYKKKKFKLHDKLTMDDLESGGTAISEVLQDIKATSPNLSIILTDGYYEPSSITLTNEVIWVISKGGNKEHPCRNIGKTILLEAIG